MPADPVFLAGQTLPAGKLQQLGTERIDYAASIDASTTDPTVGAGSDGGCWWRNGELCEGKATIIFGAGMTPGSGSYGLVLPFAPVDVGLPQMMLGGGWGFDQSSPTVKALVLQWLPVDGATARILVEGGVSVAHNAPWTWASSDTIVLAFSFPAVWP